MKTNEIANLLRITPDSVVDRLKKHDLYQFKKDYSKEEVDVITYPPWTNIKRYKDKAYLNDSKYRIKIVELFLKGGDNRTKTIAKKLKVSISFVDVTINSYLDKRYVIVESKLNFI